MLHIIFELLFTTSHEKNEIQTRCELLASNEQSACSARDTLRKKIMKLQRLGTAVRNIVMGGQILRTGVAWYVFNPCKSGGIVRRLNQINPVWAVYFETKRFVFRVCYYLNIPQVNQAFFVDSLMQWIACPYNGYHTPGFTKYRRVQDVKTNQRRFQFLRLNPRLTKYPSLWTLISDKHTKMGIADTITRTSLADGTARKL